MEENHSFLDGLAPRLSSQYSLADRAFTVYRFFSLSSVLCWEDRELEPDNIDKLVVIGESWLRMTGFSHKWKKKH